MFCLRNFGHLALYPGFILWCTSRTLNYPWHGAFTEHRMSPGHSILIFSLWNLDCDTWNLRLFSDQFRLLSVTIITTLGIWRIFRQVSSVRLWTRMGQWQGSQNCSNLQESMDSGSLLLQTWSNIWYPISILCDSRVFPRKSLHARTFVNEEQMHGCQQSSQISTSCLF